MITILQLYYAMIGGFVTEYYLTCHEKQTGIFVG